MGVKGWDFLPWRWANLDEIAPQRVAFDVFNYMIRRQSTFTAHKRRNNGRIPLSHVTVLLGLIRASLRQNILPVFVFDGPPESLKRPSNPDLIKRAESLYRQFERERDVYDEDLAEHLRTNSALRMHFAATHCREICKVVGVPYETAPSEAEMLAALMCREGLVGTVASNDVDAILFGSLHVSKQVQLTKGEVHRVRQCDVLEALELGLERLKDLAIVCGCDFYRGVKGIGPRKGVVQLKRFGNLTDLLRANGVRQSEREKAMIARAVFDEPDYLSLKGIKSRLSAPLVPRVLSMLSIVSGQEAAERATRDLVSLWRNFGKEQGTLEQWIS
jgi:flap endonuclease-1